MQKRAANAYAAAARAAAALATAVASALATALTAAAIAATATTNDLRGGHPRPARDTHSNSDGDINPDPKSESEPTLVGLRVLDLGGR